MKLLSRNSVAILSIFLMATSAWAEDIPTADPEDVGLSSERLERFSAEMEKGVAAGHFPGAVAAIARNGRVAFFKSYGVRDKEAGEPMTNDTIFRIASMTKGDDSLRRGPFHSARSGVEVHSFVQERACSGC
jgi:CubicO group peptidase (beta-lactamase class C family)